MSQYVSHYDGKTYLKAGVIPKAIEISERQQAIRQYGLVCIGEKWLQNYGISPLWEGPELDKDTQNLLCVSLIS